YALYLMTGGHFTTGLVTIAMAYLVSLVVVERIYSAGRTKLATIAWFAKLMDWLTSNRDRFLAWARATRVWAFSSRSSGPRASSWASSGSVSASTDGAWFTVGKAMRGKNRNHRRSARSWLNINQPAGHRKGKDASSVGIDLHGQAA